MRGRGVDDAGAIGAEAVGERHRLARGVIGQAQHHDIDLGHQGFARGRILAPFSIDRPDLEAGGIRQPLADFEAGRARFTIDENGRDRALEAGRLGGFAE